MKRLNRLFTLLLVVFLVTGCVKYNTQMGISEQGEVDLNITVGFANYLLDMVEEEESSTGMMTDSDKEELEKLGFKVEDYKDNDWTGVKLSKAYQIENVSSTNSVTVPLDSILEGEDTVLFQSLGNDTYKGHFTIDGNSLNASDLNSGEMSPEDMEMLKASMDISYSVTLPSAPISHNADKVEGNTLTWNVKFEGVTDIQYEFSLKKGSSNGNSSSNGESNSNSNVPTTDEKKDNSTLWIIVGIVGIAAVAIIVVVILVASKKKKNANTMMNMNVNPNMNQNMGMSPVQPTMTVPMAPQSAIPQAPVVPQQPVAPVQQPVAEPTPVATPVVEQPAMPTEPVQQPVMEPTSVVGQPQQVVTEAPVAEVPADTTTDENQPTNMQ